MGVKYAANFGIGFQIDTVEDEEYLEDILPTSLDIWKSGSEYSGRVVYYIGTQQWVEEEDWLDVRLRLLTIAEEHRLKIVSEFGLVGGLYVF